jgi:hypothetical protein
MCGEVGSTPEFGTPKKNRVERIMGSALFKMPFTKAAATAM